MTHLPASGQNLRVVLCNTSERSGGAAIAANRLHRGLLAAGVESRMAVTVSSRETPQVVELGGRIARRLVQPILAGLERIPAEKLYTRPANHSYATFSMLPLRQHRRINPLPGDILHLHWVGEGFLSPWALGRLRRPVVWTMHDSWPFTGGCHFQSTDCERYAERCGRCPELCSSREWDLSRLHWLMKRNAVRKITPVMIAPSRDYARRAAESGLLRDCRVEHIPNGIDSEVFRPIPQTRARSLLGLPQNDTLLLFGAESATDDHRKGFDLLCQALRLLVANGRSNFLPVIFGALESREPLPLPAHFLGRLHDDLTLALAYSAADVFVCPSRQESFSNTTLESLACGRPAAAFAVGGIPDMMEDGVHGFLARPHDPEDLARGIGRLLNDADLRCRMGEAGRIKVEREFALPVIVKRHTALYEEILSEAAPR